MVLNMTAPIAEEHVPGFEAAGQKPGQNGLHGAGHGVQDVTPFPAQIVVVLLLDPSTDDRVDLLDSTRSHRSSAEARGRTRLCRPSTVPSSDTATISASPARSNLGATSSRYRGIRIFFVRMVSPLQGSGPGNGQGRFLVRPSERAGGRRSEGASAGFAAARMCAGRCAGRIMSLWQIMAAYSTMLRSSRTFPG